jgi:hypothetical protein
MLSIGLIDLFDITKLVSNDKNPLYNFNKVNLNHNFDELIPLYKKYIIDDEKQDENGIAYIKIS